MSQKLLSKIEQDTHKNIQLQLTCSKAIEEVTEIYRSIGYRKIDASKLPLIQEVDSFLADIAGGLKKQRTANKFEVRNQANRKTLIIQHIELWRKKSDGHLINVANHLLPKLLSVFDSPDSISRATNADISEALQAVRSFISRQRYCKGGYQGLCDAVFDNNSPSHVRNSFEYLLFGNADVAHRIAQLSNPSPYKIAHFGPTNCIELLGRRGHEKSPIATTRTFEALHYLGYAMTSI